MCSLVAVRRSVFVGITAALLTTVVGCGLMDVTEDDDECEPECGPNSVCNDGICEVLPEETNNAGNVGASCDPSLPSDENVCNGFCLETEKGQGICIDACGPDGSNPCQGPDVKCNEIPDPDTGEIVHVCLPNGSCGDLSFQGTCNGDVARKCGLKGPVSTNCSRKKGPNGEPKKCARVSESYGVSCVSSDYGGGCGDIPVSGTCEGDTLVYCRSVESGGVEREPCGSGATCVVENGEARCKPKGGGRACGAVSESGECRGDTYVWCDASTQTLERSNCSSSGKTCGWDQNRGAWGCVESGGASHTVEGAFFYEDRPPTPDGYDSKRHVPIMDAIVQVRDAQSNAVLGASHTATDGTYSVGYNPSGGDVYVAVLAATNHNGISIAIRDCPSLKCSNGGNVYAATTSTFTPTKSHELGALAAPASGVGRAFNVFTVFRAGFEFAKTRIGKMPPPLTGHWKPGAKSVCGEVSCFIGKWDTVLVTSTSSDRDGFDDAVIGHEFGHFVEDAFSRSDNPGGSHDGSPADPRLAWGEGYGTFFGSTLMGSPRYLDVMASGVLEFDISNTRYQAERYSRYGQSQLVSELLVAELLWHLSNGGRGANKNWNRRIFDVLTTYFPTNRLVDRGVKGVDLVDFLDGWFCRGHGAESTVRQLVVRDKHFPYDFAGPKSCP